MTRVSVEFGRYKAISEWQPEIGDTVTFNGLFWNHWYGVVTEVLDSERVRLRVAGLPKLICTNEYKVKDIEIRKVRSSRGAYCVMKAIGGVLHWLI